MLVICLVMPYDTIHMYMYDMIRPFAMCLFGYFFVLFIERIAFTGPTLGGHGHGHAATASSNDNDNDAADRMTQSNLNQSHQRGVSSAARPTLTIQQQYHLPTIFDTRKIATTITQRDGSVSVHGAPRAVLAYQIAAEVTTIVYATSVYQCVHLHHHRL
jgi:hypothetical protein